LTATVLFPVPPFWFAIAMVVRESGGSLTRGWDGHLLYSKDCLADPEGGATLYSDLAMPSLRMTIERVRVLGEMLSDPDAEWYGLDLSKRSHLKPGTIYPILDRLLKAGWVERRWEDIDPTVEGRPRRRLYRLTALGATQARWELDQQLAALQHAQPAKRNVPSYHPRPA
jgi:DNA-binding MarR family transcriptional regulator